MQFDLKEFDKKLDTLPVVLGLENTIVFVPQGEESGKKETHKASVLIMADGFETSEQRAACLKYFDEHSETFAESVLNEVLSWTKRTDLISGGERIRLVPERTLQEALFDMGARKELRSISGARTSAALALTDTANAADVVYVPSLNGEYLFMYTGDDGCAWLRLTNRAVGTNNKLALDSVLRLADDADNYMHVLMNKLAQNEAIMTSAFQYNANGGDLAKNRGLFTAKFHTAVGDDSYPYEMKMLQTAVSTVVSVCKEDDGSIRIIDRDIARLG